MAKKNKREAIEKLIAEGKEKGSLDYNTISKELDAFSIDQEQLDDIFSSFSDLGIDVVGDGVKEMDESVTTVKTAHGGRRCLCQAKIM